MAYRNYATANSRIVDPSGNGDFKTIAAALTASASGQTIFIRPGTYSENPTLKAGVNLCAFNCDAQNNVIINGKCTFTAAGTVSISGIQLQTNSDYALAVTGSAASKVVLTNCYINALNNTAIDYTSSSASSSISIYNSQGNIGTTGISYFTHSSAGQLVFFQFGDANGGASTTASTASAGVITMDYCNTNFPITTSGSAIFSSNASVFETGTNTTVLTVGGSGGAILIHTEFVSGSASAVSISSSANMSLCIVSSSNTNAITGAGTLVSNCLIYTGTSHLSNVTTQTGGAASGLTQGTAPSAGFIGEQIRSAVASGSAVSLSTGTTANITSISLTAGIWDISCCVKFTGATSTSITLLQFGISPTSATIDVLGDDCGSQSFQSPSVGSGNFFSIPSYRVTLSATTTYYLVAQATFTVSTQVAYGRISATRVG